ncbi:threonine/serine dehydratase [Alteromonas halophila]|uniref:Serine/threonine dehydratase n=1 Tax=Alteromonas halophila TaxID=516698 RepID=A0A918JHM9_9ALTE|nr:threonine/serine dehydratase [Alteromonas halophila]GGW79121.1 serine/threonine dehydratase [Alteromonas halophila]
MSHAITHIVERINTTWQRMQSSSTPPVHTPLDISTRLSDLAGMQVYLKGEHLQHTGSFKYRGALSRILALDDAGRKKGVITASSGNHGMACAMAAREAGVAVRVFVPQDASPLKVQKIEALGAQVIHADGDCLVAEKTAAQEAEREGKAYISPYNDELVMAGQGTIGKELLHQQPHLDAVFIAVGGGGLISGIGAWLKAHSPATRVIGCWPQHAPAMAECLKAGKICEVDEKPTLSDGTAGGVDEGAITFDVCQQVIDDTVLVSEEEIARALKDMVAFDNTIVEGAAAVAIAGALKYAPQLQGQRAAVILCGKNIAFDKLKTVLCTT